MRQKQIKLYAAPLQGFTEAPWRNAHEQAFGGIEAYYVPFIRREKGEIRNKDRREVLALHNRVNRLIPQLIASEPDELAYLTDFLTGQGYREIDVNMGCPFPPLASRSKGSGILPYPQKVAALLDRMEEYSQVAFSVKMRLGWQSPDEWKNILPLLNDSCVCRIVLHPRIGKQQYKGEIDAEAFAAFYEACRKPLVYNGDLTTAEQMEALLATYPSLEGLMLGRGLLASPWLAYTFRHPDEEMTVEERRRRLRLFHQLQLSQYTDSIEGGERQLLQKLKTMWEYLLPDLEKRVRKSILKSTVLSDYLNAVNQALAR